MKTSRTGDRVGSSTARNSMLMPDKEVKLTGAERAFILRALDRVPPGARTGMERELYNKVR